MGADLLRASISDAPGGGIRPQRVMPGGGGGGGSPRMMLRREAPARGGGGGGASVKDDPSRFANIMRAYRQRGIFAGDPGGTSAGLGPMMSHGDQTDVNVLTAQLSHDDAVAIMGPQSNAAVGAYRPSEDEFRAQAAKQLLAAGYDPRGPFSRLVAGR